MKTFKNVLDELILPFILCWFFMSMFVDIFTVPTVFKYASNLQEAGRIGMTVFGRFNNFEIFFALFILAGILVKKNLTKRQLSIFITLSVALFCLSLFYKFFMTPMIANSSIRIHQITPTDPEYQILQNRHNYYHNLYRYFDSAKLVVLLIYASWMIGINSKNKHKECV